MLSSHKAVTLNWAGDESANDPTITTFSQEVNGNRLILIRFCRTDVHHTDMVVQIMQGYLHSDSCHLLITSIIIVINCRCAYSPFKTMLWSVILSWEQGGDSAASYTAWLTGDVYMQGHEKARPPRSNDCTSHRRYFNVTLLEYGKRVELNLAEISLILEIYVIYYFYLPINVLTWWKSWSARGSFENWFPMNITDGIPRGVVRILHDTCGGGILPQWVTDTQMLYQFNAVLHNPKIVNCRETTQCEYITRWNEQTNQSHYYM